ncbi:MAG: Signal transduction histidine-protein kinase BarA [Syntrophus sp. PtaB.Bin001]|nr:MAG: Signal transduction histidine-protein kinase BarA [Syntrophus sp. PtaB.Bin001]
MKKKIKTKEQLVQELEELQKRIVEQETEGETTLRKSEAEYRTIFENTGCATIIGEEDTTISLANTEYERLSGYGKAELEGKKSWMDFIEKADSKKMYDYHILRIGDPQAAPRNYETRFISRDGRIRDIFMTVAMIPGTRKSVLSFMDITERKQAEREVYKLNEELKKRIAERTRQLEEMNEVLKKLSEREAALKESEERYRTLVENVNIGVYRVAAGSQGCFIQLNPAMVKMFGYDSTDELMKVPVLKIYQDPEKMRKFGGKIKQFGFVKDEELQLQKKDGEPIWASATAMAQYDADGAIKWVDGVIEDITERKRAEEALQLAKEEAEAANRAKSDFLASMSHEIRTPMHAILGMAELLSETPLTPEQRKYVEVFKNAGENLLNVINDILDLSKVESGHLELENTDFDLAEIVEKTGEVLAIRAHDKGVELVCHILPDVPVNLIGDPIRLRQILVNLIGNAVKFTEKGEIVVEVRRKEPEFPAEEHGETVDLLFSVSDTGIGVPKEKIDMIFEKFMQVDSSISRKYGGTGLGLSIAKHLVELMGGQIRMESETGKGTKVYFTASFGIRKGYKKPAERYDVEMKGLQVIIIDDNATNRMILREILSGWGVLAAEAEDGESGIAKIKQAQESGKPYDLILLDHYMPYLDGFGVAKRIKEDPIIQGLTIVMLTSDLGRGDPVKFRDSGIAAYLTKPVKREDLKNIILTAVGKAKAAVLEPSMTTPPVPKKHRALSILMAEDSDDNRLLILSYLKNYPYRVDIAENGEVAVEKFKKGKYDLVLMDIQMPVMDGYTATGEIRKWERDNNLKATPIIALTAYAYKDDKQKSLDAGCNGHLIKPIKKAVLLSAIEEYAYGETRYTGERSE